MDFHEYVSGIAEARYALRKAFRIVEEHAKKAGLDPLEHQGLLQIFGSDKCMLQVSSVAERLDIVPAFASRLIRELETKGYVTRRASARDRRVTEVEITEAGKALVEQIDKDVQIHLHYFQQLLPVRLKITALSVMALYIGLDIPADAIGDLVEHTEQP